MLERISSRLLPYFFTPAKFSAYASERLQLPGCRDVSCAIAYSRGQLVKIPKPLVFYYDQLFELLSLHVNTRTAYSVIHGGDGEAYFLQRKAVGNIPTRHYTKAKDLKSVDLTPFREGFLQCDSILVGMYRNNQRMFYKLYGRNIFADIPVECVYALIASRRLLRTSWQLGIIGNDHLIPIIQRLLKHPEYREYIGRSECQDYIPVPQRGAANDPLALAESIQAQLKDNIQVYLVGMGSAKMAVLHRLSEVSRSVFLDVGVGIHALAGVVNLKRPYFADWVNFRLSDFDYSQVDPMLADMNSGVFL